MNKEKIKLYFSLVSITIALVLVVVYFKNIMGAMDDFLALLAPLFIGIAIAFVLNRPYESVKKFYLKKCKIKKKPSKILAIASVYILALGGVALLFGFVIPEITKSIVQFVNSADVYTRNIQNTVNYLMDVLGLKHVDISALMNMINKYLGTISSALEGILHHVAGITAGIISAVVTTFISLALSVYLLSGKENLIKQVKRTLRVYLTDKTFVKVNSLYKVTVQVFDDYIEGQCKEAFILGILCFIGMAGLRLDYAGLISVIIGVTALVPILGAYIGAAVGALLLLFISPAKALTFIIFLIILQQIEGNIIYPRVVGRNIGLPGIWVLLGISVGGGMFGILGMLIAVPLTTIVYQLLKNDVLRREREKRRDCKNEN